ncbi:MAG: FadR/GntR family transcriptional regulator [Comamonas sp.]
MPHTLNAPRSQGSSKVHTQVVDAIGQLIVAPPFGPNTTLPNEEELCTRLCVSRTAIREAIKVLGAKGMLEAKPRAGTRVRPFEQWNLFDPDVLRWINQQHMGQALIPHLTTMREIVEPAAAAIAARIHTPCQIEQLTQAFTLMESAQDIHEWVSADLRFHQAILNATNNPLIASLGAMIASALESLLSTNAQQARHFNEALPQHRKVFEAIRNRNSEDASLWMRAILADTRALFPCPN